MDIGLNLATETVGAAGLREPFCVEPNVSVRQALGLLRNARRGSVLVCRDERLVGIFTERDALRLLAAEADLDVPIERVMTPKPVYLGPGDTLSTAVARMSANGYRRLPIVDADGRPVGLLSARAIVHWLVQHFPEAVYNLPPVSKPATQQREGP